MARFDRLKSQYESLEDEYNLISEKLKRLREASILSTDASQRFQLEKQIENTVADLQSIEEKLEEIELELYPDEKQTSEPTSISPKPEKIELTQVNIFIAFAHRDLDFYYDFEKHLTLLKRDGIINKISSRNIDEEHDWHNKASDDIRISHIVLFLVSADFLTSDYIVSAPEVHHAFEQQKLGIKRVIPIIVRPVDWSSAPFAHLQVLPRNAIPATDTSWGSLDRAFIDIISGLRRIIEQKEAEEPEDQPESRYVPETIYPLYEVFKESGVPTVTFISPPNFERLKMAIEQPGRGVVIEGPSGIGKTTALKEAIHQLKEKGFVNSIRYLSARNIKDIEKLKQIEEWHHGIVAIDDFHRLQQPLSNELADRLKYLADIESDKNLLLWVFRILVKN